MLFVPTDLKNANIHVKAALKDWHVLVSNIIYYKHGMLNLYSYMTAIYNL